MKTILFIETSPRGKDSASRSVSNTLLSRLTAMYPTAKVVRRDLSAESLPHLDGATLRAIAAKDVAEQPQQLTNESMQSEVARAMPHALQSDRLTDELLEADLLVIATPMWNFGIPSMLKAWVDLVVRPGKTFQYVENGVIGLAKGKKAILVLASGGVFSSGPWRPWDFVEPYLRQILGFIGIDDVQTVRAEGMNIPDLAGNAIPKANKDVESLAL
ncbi:FMN-dependent NADH-azoreductase [Ralstonia pseudosolanacearum]|uniref:FMN-dependent NADH-azoreductase n=1 Tax=Ralstonia pseudosolanacearum TaxID=1310165 RepID=UPI001FFBCD1B|nr:FMN-dependent NADH-azoreductase [Ralstonia pseudosolanacearum]